MNHKKVSIVKSLIRLFGTVESYRKSSLVLFLVYFFIAEILGIIEELVDKRFEVVEDEDEDEDED